MLIYSYNSTVLIYICFQHRLLCWLKVHNITSAGCLVEKLGSGYRQARSDADQSPRVDELLDARPEAVLLLAVLLQLSVLGRVLLRVPLLLVLLVLPTETSVNRTPIVPVLLNSLVASNTTQEDVVRPRTQQLPRAEQSRSQIPERESKVAKRIA